MAGAAVGAAAGTLTIVAASSCRDGNGGDDEVKELDWELHPLGFAIGNSRHQYYVGAIAGNALLTFGFALFLTLLASALSFKRKSSFWESSASFKHPGVNMVVILFVLPGFSLASAHLLFNSEETGLRVLGGLLLTVFVSFPVVLWIYVLRPANFHAVNLKDESLEGLGNTRKAAQVTLCGRTVWVTSEKHRTTHFSERWGVCFDAYCGGRHWFVLFELGNLLLVSILSAWRPGQGTACDLRNGLTILVLGLLFVSIMIFKPFISPFEAATNGFVAFSTFLAVVLLAVAMADEDAPSIVRDAAVALVFACCVVVVLKGLLDVGCEIHDLVTQRRRATRQVPPPMEADLSVYSYRDDDLHSASGSMSADRPSTPVDATPDEVSAPSGALSAMRECSSPFLPETSFGSTGAGRAAPHDSVSRRPLPRRLRSVHTAPDSVTSPSRRSVRARPFDSPTSSTMVTMRRSPPPQSRRMHAPAEATPRSLTSSHRSVSRLGPRYNTSVRV